MEKPSPRCRQVVEFKDEHGMMYPYREPLQFEVNPNFNFMDCCDSEDEVDEDEVANYPREMLLKYVKQIRDSFGFDVDCVAPSWFEGDYVPVDLSKLERDDSVKEGAQFAIDEINAEMTSKSFELVDVERAVLTRYWMMLLTLTAKEVGVVGKVVTIQAMVYMEAGPGYQLEQWRFKPAAMSPVAEDASL